MKPYSPRGQTLLLMALTLLLMVLMVCMTLSFAMKTKEKIELQTIADTAAYSEAVATARTFNVMSVLMRTEFSLLVSSTGTQSLIDWSTEYRAAINVTIADLTDIKTNAACAGAIPTINGIISNLNAEQSRITGIYDGLDTAAARETQAINGAEAAIQSADFPDDYRVLENLLRYQSLANTIAQKATAGSRWPGEVSAPRAADAVSMREIDRKGNVGAACDEMPPTACTNTTMHQLEAVMGSRGFSFVTSRAGGAGPIQSKLQQVANSNAMTVTLGSLIGSGYFGALSGDFNHSNSTDGAARYADDHSGGMSVSINLGACSRTSTAGGEATSRLLSNLSSRTDDVHTWTGGNDTGNGPNPRHDLIGPIGQGNWPIVIDFNVNKAQDPLDVFAQPKLYAVLQRDYAARGAPRNMDPWNLFFTFRFTRSGSGSQFHNDGRSTTSGLNISKQVALATGLAYYHRPGYWNEPPNFMNPFWRATLVPATIDAQGDINTGGQDIPNSLGSVSQPAVDTVNALKGAGFQGWQ